MGYKRFEDILKNKYKPQDKNDDEDDNDVFNNILKLHKGQVIEDFETSLHEGWTKPPKRYTEDTLLAAMEKAVAEIPFPPGFSFIPWGHHCLIITKCKTVDEAVFYLRRTVERGLSRNALDDCVRADLYNTAGAAVTNFAEKLPTIQGELAYNRAD